jgi:hypothetical protein
MPPFSLLVCINASSYYLCYHVSRAPCLLI